MWFHAHVTLNLRFFLYFQSSDIMLCMLNLGIMLAVEAVVARLKEMSVAIEKPEEISQVRLLLVLPFNWVI